MDGIMKIFQYNLGYIIFERARGVIEYTKLNKEYDMLDRGQIRDPYRSYDTCAEEFAKGGWELVGEVDPSAFWEAYPDSKL